jgi:phage tail P2-like protein
VTTLILPRNRTPLEASIESVGAARFPLPADLVASVWNPATCPADLLPYLAWGLSVDLWDNGWNETAKREVCRKALMLHRLKTTPAGIKAHVEITGAKVLKIIRPPAREFRVGAMTDAQRTAWLDSLPQVRIYPFFRRSNPLDRHFFTGPGGVKAWHGHGFLRTTRGFDIYGRRATFYDRGVEVPITLGTTDVGEVDRVFLRRKAPNRMFFGNSYTGNGYIRTSAGQTNVITVQFADDAQPFAVPPSMDPVNVRPQRIAQGRTAPVARMFFGRFKGFLKTSFAPLMIYDRVALNDPSRTGQLRKVRSFHGHGRYGIDPYTAELQIRIPMRRPRRRSGRWNGSGYRKAPDMTPLTRAIEAVRVSKAFRDTVLINTATQGLVKFGSGLHFGEFVFGQIKEV